MSNHPQNPDQEPFVVPQEDEQGDLTFGQYLRQVVRPLVPTLRTVVFIAPLAFVLVLVVLALMGPAIGNVFSNVVNTL